MKQPHKHAELIKAWADGATIEQRSLLGSHDYTPVWEDVECPRWESLYFEYRIKPQEPKPDVVVQEHVRFWRGNVLAEPNRKANIRYVFDGETGALWDAKVLK